RTLHFGTSATYAPYEFVDADNKIVGFDIDVANAVCKEMQAECRRSIAVTVRSKTPGQARKLISTYPLAPDTRCPAESGSHRPDG
ncbi:transporter substrate-binding domain-containing protein, partial [Salmonella enterica subsp. enterica serovar Kentucky]|nr:transporter substrate-binding domain-containing protein [Salmonella enterica subsp. enterica serovar Kentucky]